MRKIITALFLVLGIIFILFLSLILIVNVYLSDVKLNKNKLVDLKRTISFYDADGNLFAEKSNGVCVTDITGINNCTKKAFVAIEDKRFYEHNGVDYRSMARAIKNNLLNLSIKEGASTISQQLIKNTHLSSEKTLKRKLSEVKLAKELEKNYSKDEILEMYLNTIYFGNNCYGITTAAKSYFNKATNELNLNESAMLAGLIKAPSLYSPNKNIEKCNKRKNVVLKEMYNQGYINKEEYDKNLSTDITITNYDNKAIYDYVYLTSTYIDQILSDSPYSKINLNIYTYYNQKLQQILKNTICDYNNYDTEKSAVLMNNKGQILAYYSTCGNNNRQIGSAIKPILVYAPAIEENVVSSITQILDEKTDFDGYSPSNYNDKYYGYVSVKDSLAKSLNVCSIKLLNYLTIDKAKNYINKTDIELSKNDNSLALALGATENGAKLTDITASYNIFSNKGLYNSPSSISFIKNNEIKTTKTLNEKRVIGEDTAFIMNDMLKNVVENGTAKKLCFSNLDLYAKTGTVGNKNGNYDAYVISYDANYTLGVWFGSKDYSNYMNNNICGGNIPSLLAKDIWEEIYKDKKQEKMFTSDKVENIKIDKIALEEEHSILIADDNAPSRYVIDTIFKKDAIPNIKSNRFSSPATEKPKTSVNNMVYKIELCQTEYINCIIYKIENDKKYKVFDTKNGKFIFTENLKPNTKYEFLILPYFSDGKNIFYGEEIKLEKIKTPSVELGEWWNDKL